MFCKSFCCNCISFSLTKLSVIVWVVWDSGNIVFEVVFGDWWKYFHWLWRSTAHSNLWWLCCRVKFWVTLLCHWKKCSVRDSWLYSAFTWLMLSFKHSWYKGLLLHISGFCFVHYLFIFLMCVVPEYPILLSPISCWQKTAHLYFLLNNYCFFFCFINHFLPIQAATCETANQILVLILLNSEHKV